MNWPSVFRQSMPHGFDVPSAKTSNFFVFGWYRQTPPFIRVSGPSSAGFTVALREDAVQPVEPAVRPPLEGVQRLVRVLAAEPLQQRLELARLVVLVLDEPEVRRRPDEHPAVPDLDPGGQVERPEAGLLPLLGHREVLPLGEHRPLVADAVAVGVFEDDDAVPRGLPLRRPARVLEALDDPDPALLVDGERDRVDHLRLAGEQLHLELGRRPSSACTVSSGVRYGWPDGLRLSNPNSFWAKAGPASEQQGGDGGEGAHRGGAVGRGRCSGSVGESPPGSATGGLLASAGISNSNALRVRGSRRPRGRTPAGRRRDGPADQAYSWYAQRLFWVVLPPQTTGNGTPADAGR